MLLPIFPSKRSSKISFQTSPEVRHQFRQKLRQLHSGNRWTPNNGQTMPHMNAEGGVSQINGDTGVWCCAWAYSLGSNPDVDADCQQSCSTQIKILRSVRDTDRWYWARSSTTGSGISVRMALSWAAAEGGGKTYRVNLGGGKRTAECALQNHFWRPQKLGLVWSVPLSFKGNDRESPKRGGGETYRGWGSKNVFGEGFFAEFTVCFPPP